jgi:predicted nucleic acid-binding protein
LSLFADTSVWSQFLRRDAPADLREVTRLTEAIEAGETVLTTGLVLQELLQGFAGPRNREAILSRFSALPFLWPDLQDHVAAAELRNACRRVGFQIGSVDALLAQLCLRHDLTMLSTDNDFRHIATVWSLKLFD